MTNEQRQILREQMARCRQTKAAADREMETLRAMLVMHDARFADPASGLTFDTDALTIGEPNATDGGR